MKKIDAETLTNKLMVEADRAKRLGSTGEYIGLSLAINYISIAKDCEEYKSMPVLEKEVETYLRNQIRHIGGMCLKFPAVFVEGIPDRIVILPKGRVAFVELKRPSGGRLSEAQKYQIGKLEELGCTVAVVHNKDEVDDLIKRLLK